MTMTRFLCSMALLLVHLGTLAHGFTTLKQPSPSTHHPHASRIDSALFKSAPAVAAVAADTESSSSSGDKDERYANKPLSAPSPREFEWWTEDCDACLDALDAAGGERFVAVHDEATQDGTTHTNNWLHVTSSRPSRRVQYEVRYVPDTQTMAGVVRFGTDCEGPPGCAHGGSLASVADALTATCCYFAASERWGMTTQLNCNYREAVPLGEPVNVAARVTELKARKASLEWTVSSLTQTDKKGEAVRHAFGTASFLLPRLPKKE